MAKLIYIIIARFTSQIINKHSAVPLVASLEDLRRTLKSFSSASSGGPDGLRPQHLRDLFDASAGGTFEKTLLNFCNLILSGRVPDIVRPYFFGASLHALCKKDGGIRPIAVGLTLRRLCSKLANSLALIKCQNILNNRQFGVGTKSGAK